MKRHGRPIKYGFGVQLHPQKSFQGKHSEVRFGMSTGPSLAKLRLLQVPVQLQAGPLFRSWNVSLISSSERRQMNQMTFKRRRKTNFQAAKQWIFGAPGPFLSKNLQQSSWEQLSGNTCSFDHKSKNGDGNNPASSEVKPSSNMAVPAISSGLHSWGRRKQIYTLQTTSYLPTHAPSLSTGHMTSSL